MPRLRVILALLALAAPGAAAAQEVVTSARPDRVAVTLYRDPNRGSGEAFSLSWLNGFALVSETRQIALPAGESVIRFEGVAGGIIPQSAIVTGFPQGIVERNRDAYLLSPATLLDRSLGRRVHIRRTSRATGAVTEGEAVIMTGADGGVVLQTAAGYEALRCTGLPETIVYDSVPVELSPRPTLSVRARVDQPVTATITLSYLATGFDWQANYIVNLDPRGGRADIFAWLTLASTDETSFPDAETQAVAGNLNYNEPERQPREGGPLQLRCWPAATTSDIPLRDLERADAMGMVGGVAGDGSDVVITGTRTRRPNLESNVPITSINAQELTSQENLGDLKLYRLPGRVTIAANGQKQVAMLTQPRVRVEMVYRQRMGPGGHPGESFEVPLWLVTRNREADGLGLPLPAGSVALFAQGPDRPILLGEGIVPDRAVDEDVEIPFGASPLVRTQVREVRTRTGGSDYELVVTNAQPNSVRFEAEFEVAPRQFRSSSRLFERDGMRVWAATVPANGQAVFRFRRLNRE